MLICTVTKVDLHNKTYMQDNEATLAALTGALYISARFTNVQTCGIIWWKRFRFWWISSPNFIPGLGRAWTPSLLARPLTNPSQILDPPLNFGLFHYTLLHISVQLQFAVDKWNLLTVSRRMSVTLRDVITTMLLMDRCRICSSAARTVDLTSSPPSFHAATWTRGFRASSSISLTPVHGHTIVSYNTSHQRLQTLFNGTDNLQKFSLPWRDPNPI